MKIALIVLFVAVIALAYAAPSPKGKDKGGKPKDTHKNPPVKSPKDCTEAKKCATNKGGEPKEGTTQGRHWAACGAYPVCAGVPTAWGGCYYYYSGYRYCLW